MSKSKQRYITSLQVKKYRLQEQKFLVEGAKSVQELLHSPFKIEWIGCTPEFCARHQSQIAARDHDILTTEELSKISSFKTNEAALAVVHFPLPSAPQISENEWIVSLDNIRDPGNLGTIIRTAHWYGVKQIVASQGTADVYNPKAIAAAMGSFCHVNFHYVPLAELFAAAALPVYGAFTEGKNIHATDFPKGGIIVIGNESNGISEALCPYIAVRVAIPRLGSAESLNAGIATGIVLDNIFRK